jgi:hypothetical protein
VVNDSEAGPHNSLQWIRGILFAEVGVVFGVDVLVDVGVLELRHHGQVFQTAILLAADGLVQLFHGERPGLQPGLAAVIPQLSMPAEKRYHNMFLRLLIQLPSVWHLLSLAAMMQSLITAFTMCQMSYVCLIGANFLLRNSALTSRRSFLSELLRSVVRARTPIFLLPSLATGQEEFGGQWLRTPPTLKQ